MSILTQSDTEERKGVSCTSSKCLVNPIIENISYFQRLFKVVCSKRKWLSARWRSCQHYQVRNMFYEQIPRTSSLQLLKMSFFVSKMISLWLNFFLPQLQLSLRMTVNFESLQKCRQQSVLVENLQKSPSIDYILNTNKLGRKISPFFASPEFCGHT